MPFNGLVGSQNPALGCSSKLALRAGIHMTSWDVS
jgi:hypothetical protein